MRNVLWFCWTLAASCIAGVAADFRIGAHTFTLPPGFEIELVAGTNLVPRPIEADFDEQGRLYVTDSSGSNDKIQKQLEDKPHRIVRLTDTDGDGRFDTSATFADKMMFPEGAMWLNGSLYVAAPPSIWKLTDTNNDGTADVRVEWFKGETLTGCANDLHGPYAGPDGWIYWSKGAFAKQTYTLPNGKKFTTRASHIFRARPDGTGIEPVMTGGMDNPVGLAFTPEGERIFSCTFFQHPANGQRDGLIHAIYGGVYGKVHDVIDEHPRTGDVMPVLTHFGPAAPAGLLFYESPVYDEELENNLFACNFNLHKVTRHLLKTSGSTYKTTDSDFLVSDNTDFHPTDVLEDADGSLIVIDTGGWYKLCCPTSQLHKPDVLGGIYRVRKRSSPKVKDPRGQNIDWARLSAADAVNLLDDPRPVVVRRAVESLAGGRGASIPQLREALRHSNSETIRRNAVWALTRIDGPEAREAMYAVFAPGPNGGLPGNESLALTVLNAISVRRDREAVEARHGDSFFAQVALSDASGHRNGFVRRAAAEVFGRVGSKVSTPVLLKMAETPDLDRLVEHSIIYALIEIADVAGTRAGLQSRNPQVQRVSFIALNEMAGGDLKPGEVTPLLAHADTHALLRQTALWIVERRTNWGAEVARAIQQTFKFISSSTENPEFARILARSAADPEVQQKISEMAQEFSSRPTALSAMRQSRLNQVPDRWMAPLIDGLRSPEPGVLLMAVRTARALNPGRPNSDLSAALVELAERIDVPAAVRVGAAASVSGGIRNLTEPLYSRLVATLVQDSTVMERADAATALARARLSNARLLELAAHLKRVGPMELPRVLPAFAQSTNEAVGLKLIDSLQASKAAQGLRAEVLKPAITNFPSTVQRRAEVFLASLNADTAKEKAHLEELLASAKNGDVRRGQSLFNSAKTACSSCHAIGYLGGNVGPDLTRIGQVRNERDLLEAIIYPNASFVRSYEPVIVTTKSGEEFSGVLKKDAADEVVLVTGPNAEQRVARADVAEMRPGAVSVMPSGLADQLSKQEVADLLAFLKATRW